MRKIILLGSSGMIGYTLTKHLQKGKNVKVVPAVRENRTKYFNTAVNISSDFEGLDNLISKIKPHYVINCIGLTKHLASEQSNAYFFPNILVPRFLKMLKAKHEFLTIHISSDCVYSGRDAPYTENYIPDALDNYGISKAISENDLKDSAMVLRTSTVGHEYESKNGLVEWFLSQSGSITGFKNAFFNGVTTLTLAKIIEIIINSENLFEHGIFNVSSERISKFKFLNLLRDVYQKNIEILPDYSFKIDRSLVMSRKIDDIWDQISWEQQIREMKEHYQNEFY